jgi:hypothetical protein
LLPRVLNHAGQGITQEFLVRFRFATLTTSKAALALFDCLIPFEGDTLSSFRLFGPIPRDNREAFPDQPGGRAPLPPTAGAQLGFGLTDWFRMILTPSPPDDRPPYEP